MTCELLPIVLDERGFPRLASGVAAENLIAMVRELSCGFGTEIELRDGVGAVEPKRVANHVRVNEPRSFLRQDDTRAWAPQ
jgi:hypothetical protein